MSTTADLIELAASPEQNAAKQAARDSARIRNAGKRTIQRTGDLVVSALEPAIEYVLTVGQNNTPAKTVGRSDVKSSLVTAADMARAQALAQVEAAWKVGITLGNSAARKQAKALGLPKPSPGSPATDVLEKIQGDVDAILKAAPRILSQGYVDGGKDSLAAGQRMLAYRLSLAAEAALKFSAAQSQLEAQASTQTQKMWKTTSAVPCSHCKHLDGMTLDWDQEFPIDIPGLPILKTYTGSLFAPPRHPHCACVLVSVLKKGT